MDYDEDELTPEEIISHVLDNNYDYPYESFRYVAEDILKDLEYHKMVAQILEKDKEIAELKFDLELFMDLCDKKDEWLEVQRKQIAELKAEIENQYELAAFKWSLE